MTRAQIGAVALPLLLLAHGEVLARPLDSSNPTARSIQVEFEISPDLTTVGQVYAPPIAAQYSASGNVGTVVIPSAEYEAFVGWPALSISDITIEIDLTTLEAQVVDTAGSVSDPPFAEFVFSWNLDTTQPAGFVDLFEPLHCSSQAQVDDICLFLPVFCGATCVLVPGAGYDAATGKLNMVGFEFQSGCGETGCLDVNQFLARGDLRLSEVAPVPVLSLPGLILFGALLLGTSIWMIQRRLSFRT